MTPLRFTKRDESRMEQEALAHSYYDLPPKPVVSSFHLIPLPFYRTGRRLRFPRFRLAALFSLVAALLLVLYTFLRRYSSPRIPSRFDGLAIVSLASSTSRLESTLPYTLKTLLAQASLPKEVRVYFPENEEYGFSNLDEGGNLDQIFYHPRISVYFVEDRGPAIKFLPLLTEFLSKASAPAHAHLLKQPFIILDDGYLYPPSLIETLLSTHGTSPYFNHRAVLGFQGQRIPSSLHNLDRKHSSRSYTVHGWDIVDPYRVGYLSSCSGYLVFPEYFLPQDILPSIASHPPSLSYAEVAPILNVTSAPRSRLLMDDVWMSAHLSTLHHPRYVIPLPQSSPPVVSLDHPLKVHPSHSTTSCMASSPEERDAALSYFLSAWEAEGEGDWDSTAEWPGSGGGEGIWFVEDQEAEEMLGKSPVWDGWWRRLVVSRMRGMKLLLVSLWWHR
ncbi:hypothetical protein JAAARDRAFT_67136 [Jaapia argillacea MUCL 33604]|uniref:Uncharacterized protein n=1 Tax=Jaapia argillacea MUCL 33604 TaxID=933084 RepID=A0A067QB11_9AGAM|nr:hypothetical protein JAAARDRAFT_67136 [Jaapia argillacea MUCL 33604]